MTPGRPSPTVVALEDVWRRESPHVLAALLRRHGDLADCEDAAQEALEAAAGQWPGDGVPDHPRGWLIRVASRRLIDRMRADRSRVIREQTVAADESADAPAPPDVDDSLQLLLLCCHPVLTRSSQVALTLRAVSGLGTAEIAAAFLVPEATMGQRLSRAKATLRHHGVRFELPDLADLPTRVAAVLDVLHLVFNEGYARTTGQSLVDSALTLEAIRVTRQLYAALPDHDEVAGALSLMLLTKARESARTDERGDLVLLADQDRSLWDQALIGEGVAILEGVLPRGRVGRFQLQAAIAAVHAEAPAWADTDWLQLCLLYQMLSDLASSPAVTLNRAVAVAMAFGPEHGLAIVQDLLEGAPAMSRYHRTFAVRAHLRELTGDVRGAMEDYRSAAQLSASGPEQRYLNARMARLGQG